MKLSIRLTTLTAAALGVGLAGAAHADYIVNDAWSDGSRTAPASPDYSEYGTDADLDGDLESAWYASSGSLNGTSGNAINPNVGMVGTVGASSASWTTYFAPALSAIQLNNPGDQLKITWTFTLSGVNTSDNGHNFRIAIVDTPEANRISSDTTPGSAQYRGYAMLGNMATTLNIQNAFRIAKKSDPSASTALLSDSSWGAVIANDANTSGQTGYVADTEYTFTFIATRTEEDALAVSMTMAGGELGGDGLLEASTIDADPHTFQFDTFSIRARSADHTASQFTTTRFQVEFVPEPASAALLTLGALTLTRRRT